MVRYRKRLIALLLLLPLLVSAQEVRMRLIVDENGVSANQDFLVRLEVAMDEELELDETTFEMNGQALDVQFVSQGLSSSLRIVNGKRQEERKLTQTFAFEVPGKTAGVHLLPAVSVMISGKRYSSEQTTYTVIEPETSDAFILDVAVDGPQPIYPGQRVRFVYTLTYGQEYERQSFYLPLLDPRGFRRVNDTQQRTFARGNFNVWELSQEVEALEPGTYSFGPSYIEGRFFRRSFFGRPMFTSPLLRASAPLIDVTVQDFPTQGRPPYFEGAVGNFRIRSELLSGSDVAVGDKLILKVAIEGEGALSTVKLPRLERLPNFLEQFRLSDLPETSSQSETSKEFVFELRPMQAGIDEVPSIPFAFFEPNSQSFQSLSTQAIPIRVRELDGLGAAPTTSPLPPVELAAPQPQDTPRVAILGNFRLAPSDLYPRWTQGVRFYLVLVLMALLLVAQLFGRRAWLRAKQQQDSQARRLLAAALDRQHEHEEFYPLLEKALIEQARTRYQLPSHIRSAKELPQTGTLGELRSFLSDLEDQRYSGGQLSEPERIAQKAQQLFDRL